MLYLIISGPHPSKPEDAKNTRLEFWSWIKDLKAKNKVVCSYPRVGRGAIVIFDVSSNDELHKLVTQWLNIAPVSFDIYPLATPLEARKLLKEYNCSPVARRTRADVLDRSSSTVKICRGH